MPGILTVEGLKKIKHNYGLWFQGIHSVWARKTNKEPIAMNFVELVTEAMLR